jgi:predicted acylesterase/phospholipase RssA
MKTNRFEFLRTISGATAAAALSSAPVRTAASIGPAQRQKPFASHALVLSGGGARGAYQAGLACALAERSGIRDGQPLAPYGLICGTSIGALNAWFIATGQYSALRHAWSTIASEHIIELKRPYSALAKPHRFIGERVVAALKLAVALATRERAVAQGDSLFHWMEKHMDPGVPLLMPVVWAVTNLTTQSPEYFYRLPPSFGGEVPERIARAMRLTLGENIAVREIPDGLLLKALFASTAMPIIFDPVTLPMADGTPGLYVDGSVANDAAVSIAHAIAQNIHVVLVEAASARSTYRNASSLALGIYNTMQREILEGAMRQVQVQSVMASTLQRHTPAVTLDGLTAADRTRMFVYDLPVSELSYLRPQRTLPASVNSFDQQASIDETFALGELAAASGFAPYVSKTFSIG